MDAENVIKCSLFSFKIALYMHDESGASIIQIAYKVRGQNMDEVLHSSHKPWLPQLEFIFFNGLNRQTVLSVLHDN